MSLVAEILAELRGMFLSDARLSLGTLAAVAVSAVLRVVPGIDPLYAGAVLLLGCLAVLAAAILHAAR